MGLRRKGKGRLEDSNLLKLVPVRLADWRTVDDDRVMLIRPVPHVRGWRAIAERLAHLASTPRLRLDPIGSHVWKQLDGAQDVQSVAESMRRRFADDIEPAETRLGEFVRRLHSEGMIAYQGIDLPADAPQGRELPSEEEPPAEGEPDRPANPVE